MKLTKESLSGLLFRGPDADAIQVGNIIGWPHSIRRVDDTGLHFCIRMQISRPSKKPHQNIVDFFDVFVTLKEDWEVIDELRFTPSQ